MAFPGSSDRKELACSVGDSGSIPGSGRSPGEGHSNPLHSNCLEKSMDRGTRRAAVHGIAKSWATKTKGHTSGFRLYTGWVKHFELIVSAQISYSSFLTLCQ